MILDGCGYGWMIIKDERSIGGTTVLGASKSPSEYDVFYEFDFEGMAKFILDMHLSMYRERNQCHVERGCGSLNPWGYNLALERPDFH